MSHNFSVVSKDMERMFLSSVMILVDEIERRRVRARVIRELVLDAVLDDDAGRSAERKVREKSQSAERSTREEGKKWWDVTVLRWGLEMSRCEIGGVMECGGWIWGLGKEELEDGRRETV
jgi:hypothetical protein